ncbi:MAG: hypothetical protein ACRDPV_13875 [Gaiellaceae bacterium]
MSPWLTLIIIVLVSVAIFADHRRNSVDEFTDVSGHEEIPGTASDSLVRPNVRDGLQNGHPGSIPRPLSTRRAGQDVRKGR